MIKTGLIGAGYWGPNLARVLNQSTRTDFVAACDQDSAKLAKVLRQYPSLKGYDSAEALLASDVDAVLIATPISTHYELARQALLSGKHVFVEKPLADSAAKASALVGLAEEEGLTLMTGHTFVYSPPVVKVKELIDNGTIGDLLYISLSRVNLGLYQKDVDVIWDLAVHDISILLYWVGEFPVRAFSLGRACVQQSRNDVAFLWLQFPSGLIASLEVSWLSPQKLRRTSVVGSNRMVVYDDTDPSEKVKVYDRGVVLHQPQSFGEYQLTYRQGDMVAPNLSNVEPLVTEVEHFVHCVESGQQPRTDGRFGLDVVRVLEMAIAGALRPEEPVTTAAIAAAGEPR